MYFAMSYADTFAVASALEHDATLVTGDPEFRQVVHLVKILCKDSLDIGTLSHVHLLP